MRVGLLDSRRWKTRVELANAIFQFVEVQLQPGNPSREARLQRTRVLRLCPPNQAVEAQEGVSACSGGCFVKTTAARGVRPGYPAHVGLTLCNGHRRVGWCIQGLSELGRLDGIVPGG
jgi:hypothetical protein